MKRSKRSVWHERSLAGKRGRPKSCPQAVWYSATPERERGMDQKRGRDNGWQGGRDRAKPRKSTWTLYERGVRIGGVARYQMDGMWLAWVDSADITAASEWWFGQRWRAKRWVAAEKGRIGR